MATDVDRVLRVLRRIGGSSAAWMADNLDELLGAARQANHRHAVQWAQMSIECWQHAQGSGDHAYQHEMLRAIQCGAGGLRNELLAGSKAA